MSYTIGQLLEAAQQLNATGTYGVGGPYWNNISAEALLAATAEETFGIEPAVFVAYLEANVEWTEVRKLRNVRLQNCDWTVGSDSPLTESTQTEWRTYRQALRDVTNQDDPKNITWPVEPGVSS
jgi:hypothetical protein|tara:strand:- start:1798 stop:2169 length:372 start_codon:yes stop_codon:yes gene_type:complete